MAKVLLTGVTGFLGSHTTIQLLEEGYEVIGTMRDLARADSIKSIIGQHTKHINALSFTQAELQDKSAWQKAVKDVDYVLHLASPVPLKLPSDPSIIVEPAKEGTLNVLSAAAAAGVKRVVITSSIAAISYGKTKRKSFDEADWSDETNIADHTAYSISKTIAEKAAWDFIHQDTSGLEMTVINPGVILGPILEQDFSTSIAAVKILLDRSTPLIPKIGWSLVDVRSVAALHIKAMESDKAANERFLATNQYYTMKEISEVLKKHFPDRKIPSRELPDTLLKLVSNFDKKLKNVIMDLGAHRTHNNEKAKKLLGWQPLSDEQAIVDAARSLINFGVV
ncbi:MAG: SDR family oxidoreductase [Thermonemataceae bacterium]